MAQQTDSQRVQTAFFVTLSALGGLLAIPAVVGYMAWLPISALMAVMAWRLWSSPVRRPFLVLAAGALVIGLVIHLMPPDPGGGVGGAGFALAFAALVWLGFGVFKLRKMEAGLARG